MVSSPQRRQRVEYKKPGKINVVSIGLVMFLGLLGYIGYCIWPSMYLSSEVSNLLRNDIILWYQANLRPSAERSIKRKKISDDLYKAIQKKGILDPELKLELYGDKKVVWLEARFKTRVDWLWLNKTWDWNHATRVETSAERVDW